jgi:hypothetical protein
MTKRLQNNSKESGRGLILDTIPRFTWRDGKKEYENLQPA